LIAAVVVLAALSYLALWLIYRLCQQAMFAQQRSQRDTSSIVSELLAHWTLAETGNQVIAGQMLAHSNAHGMRTELPQVWTPTQEFPGNEIGAHESPEIQVGVEEDIEIPAPEET
jgi:hypothetical protein